MPLSHSDHSLLFTPVSLGALTLPNRILMAPMTRLRADSDLAPTELVDEYYTQRASAGLIVSESIMVSPHGDGLADVPGIYTDRQRHAWQRVTRAVHAAGGRIVAQLATIGRPRYAPTRGKPRPAGWAMAEPLVPHHFTSSEVAEIAEHFAGATEAARLAGFDGVEIHNGNGFLLDQFLREGANRRDDQYGGTIENRIRLTLEIVEAARGAWSADRVGIRLSPSATVHGAPDPTGYETFSFLLRELGRFGLAYAHVTRPTAEDRARGGGAGLDLRTLRSHFAGPMLAAGDFTRDEGERALAEGWLDAVVFGRLFAANPDLPDRFAFNAPLTPLDRDTLYTPGAAGYVDYPRWSARQSTASP